LGISTAKRQKRKKKKKVLNCQISRFPSFLKLTYLVYKQIWLNLPADNIATSTTSQNLFKKALVVLWRTLLI
jgi:hypothetical protein